MNINNPQITYIIKTKYPIECNVLQKEDYDLSRLFTDDFDNYIVIEEAKRDELITVTFFNSSLSNNEVFEKKNGGTFFIIKNINDLKKLIEMNLVFYSDSYSEKSK